jgi:hypothetical protein
VQAFHHFVFVAGAFPLERRFRHRIPCQQRGSAMERHHLGAEGGVVVFLEVGPIERDDDLGSRTEHEAHPRIEQVRRPDGTVCEQTVRLFGAMLGLAADQLGV